MNKFNDYTRTNISYMEAWDGQLWKICNPSPDASVPNFTAHHPDGTILCSALSTKLEREVMAFNKAQKEKSAA